MKIKLALGVALAAALSTAALAAPPKHPALTDRDTFEPYDGQPTNMSRGYYGPRSDVVVLGDRVVGQDPDLNIRSGLIHDPVPTEY